MLFQYSLVYPMIVPVRALNELSQEINIMGTTASMLRDAPTDSMFSSSAWESRAIGNQEPPAHLSIRHYGICLQGFLVGLCLEGALALCLYGLYQVAYAGR